jgi:hypothetical protein
MKPAIHHRSILTSVNELFEQFTNKTVESLTLWADANQQVLRQLVELSTATAAEGLRVQAELQSSAVQALKSGQAFLLAQPSRLSNLSKDPVGTVQKGVVESVEGAQRAFKLLEEGGDTITRSAGRLQQSAEQTSKDIQATFAGLASELKALCTPAEK